MGFFKNLSIIQHNERMELNAMIMEYHNDLWYWTCNECLRAFTEDNPNVTDDSQLCFECYEGGN
jgi:formylmethanofuran dehydrogenase subunit E